MNPPIGEVKAVGRGRGPWRADQTVVELRRPQRVSSPPSATLDASTTGGSSGDDVPSDVLSKAMQSKLSVEAKEFVPRGFTCTSTEANNFEFESTSDGGDINGQFDETSSYDSSYEWIYDHLSDVIKSLIDYPGQFDKLVKPLLSELLPMLEVEEIVENIIMIIIEQAITEKNFRYNGARLCSALNNHKQPGDNSSFRRILLNKLSEEHDRIEHNMENNSERVYGFIQFLGELFIQLELNKGLGMRIAVIGDALVLALNLLIQIPTVDNIKHTCDVLKLAGRFLDEDQHDEMSDFFKNFRKLLEDERAGPRVRTMITCILQLRDDNWGQVSTENSAASSASSINESGVWNNDGICYGPDHQALTAEEYKFLNDSCGRDEVVSVGDDGTVWDPDVDDQENAEIRAAFREFISQKPRS